MAQPYIAKKTVLNIGSRKGETVYGLRPFYYGVISTKQVAKQIAEESALTEADVMGVINRLANYCQSHMALGYKIKLDGMGTFYNQVSTTGTAKTEKEVTARLVRSVRPGFTPEYEVLPSGARRYALLPERIDMVKKCCTGDESATDGEAEEVQP